MGRTSVSMLLLEEDSEAEEAHEDATQEVVAPLLDVEVLDMAKVEDKDVVASTTLQEITVMLLSAKSASRGIIQQPSASIGLMKPMFLNRRPPRLPPTPTT
jgi:hypothetical protein